MTFSQSAQNEDLMPQVHRCHSHDSNKPKNVKIRFVWRIGDQNTKQLPKSKVKDGRWEPSIWAVFRAPNNHENWPELSKFCCNFISIFPNEILEDQGFFGTWIWLPLSPWMKGRRLDQRRRTGVDSYMKTSNTSLRIISSTSSTNLIYSHHISIAAPPP